MAETKRAALRGDPAAGSRPRRRSLRLPAFDYRDNGAYFFTAVTQNRGKLFGRVDDDVVLLTRAGMVVENTWRNLHHRFPTVVCDAFVTMPDHVHGILFLDHAIVVTGDPADPGVPSLPQVIGAFKSLAAREVNQVLNRTGALWQRSFHDRIVRNERELNVLRRYIEENPLRWTVEHDH
jgi:REP element-mobilizing transposase RayT